MKKILCYGDSNTYGYNPKTGGRFEYVERWPGILEHMLGREYEIIEAGKNKRTTAYDDPDEEGLNGLKEIGATIRKNYPIDLLIIMLGSNDMKVKFKASANDIANNVGLLIKEAKKTVKEINPADNKFKILVATPIQIGREMAASDFGKEFGYDKAIRISQKLPNLYKKISDKENVEFVDITRVAFPSPEDALHLTRAGHRLVAQAFFKKISDITSSVAEEYSAPLPTQRETKSTYIKNTDSKRADTKPGNLLVAQSGGPTSAINATLAGVISAAYRSPKVTGIYGAVNGIEGVFNEDMLDLGEIAGDKEMMELLCQTPSSALGSCRLKLKDYNEDEEEYKFIIDMFHRYDIKYFVYIGGNDSMDTVAKLSAYCRKKGIHDISVCGAPKTIDNDLVMTDHCPGFGSAAKYVATTISEIERDVSVYNMKAVTIVEVMGRDAGWLTAASALSRANGGRGPSLIYLCEAFFDMDQFISDVKKKMKENPAVLVVISEGIKDEAGNYISEQVIAQGPDQFGNKYISGAAGVLENVIRERIGCKVRSIELNLMQRCASHMASKTDIIESQKLGALAADLAIAGGNGVMASINRISNNPYKVEYIDVPVDQVANEKKTVPLAYINDMGNDVSDEMIKYLQPLVQGELPIKYENGIPKHLILY